MHVHFYMHVLYIYRCIDFESIQPRENPTTNSKGLLPSTIISGSLLVVIALHIKVARYKRHHACTEIRYTKAQQLFI